MPDYIAKLRDKAVASADGGQFSWEESSELFDWLTYEGEWVDLHDITCFIHLSQFLLPDADIREELELPGKQEITDNIRLAYVREAIQKFNESGGSVFSSTVVKLTDSRGRESYGCWLSETMAQAGEMADWYGCFPSKDAFFKYLKNKGWWDLKEDLQALTFDRLKEAWKT